MAAARVLDPINFLPTRPRAQPLPPMRDLTPEEQEDVVHVIAPEKLIFIQTNDEVAANYDNIDKSNQQDVAIKLF
ncbi:hypothetical protein HaLaN_32871, partial [Haematococcus lacustris]